ncbi:MAG: DUF2867 domain-containing protein [Actinomycetota bacterium]
MRLPNSVQQAHPWMISRIAPDFDLLDVWALPVEGGPDEFDAFVDGIVVSFDPVETGSVISRALFWLRLRVGGWLGWDDATKERPIPGSTETTLSARLPEDLRGSAKSPEVGDRLRQAAFVPLYRTHNEWAAEVANETVHGVLHFAWVDQGSDRYRAQMAIYVKPRGRLGGLYMRLIGPFRHLIVYPALMKAIGDAWEARSVTH